jgi:UDP-N-acetylmuramate: L-alanyl-gamma-D-glutamyl-meso-diaminopimelate ligase
MLALGAWTPLETLGVLAAGVEEGAGSSPACAWTAGLACADGTQWWFREPGGARREVTWSQRGAHNVANALAAIAAARHVGVAPAQAAGALARFTGVKRRLELRAEVSGVRVYDDFAHHPTAIRRTVEALAGTPGRRLVVVIEPRSNTMRMGEHRAALAPATAGAARVYWYQPAGLDWSLEDLLADAPAPTVIARDLDALVAQLAREAESGDDIVVMSNGAFGGIHGKLIDALRT